MKKSKGFDFKKLILNHGEKFVVVVVGLLGLMGVASARWSGPANDITTVSLTNKVRDTQTKVDSNPWPEEQVKEFRLTPDVAELARKMASPNEAVEQFVFSVPFDEPLNPVREKRAAITVLTPESPERNAVSVALALFPEEETELTATDDKDSKNPGARKPPKRAGRKDEKEESEEDRKRRERLGAVADTGRGPGAGNALLGGDPDSEDLRQGYQGGAQNGSRRGEDARRGGGGGGGRRNRGRDDDDDYQPGLPYSFAGADDEDSYGMLGPNIPTKRVRYSGGISVRYLFNLREQRKRIAEALHISVTDPATAAYAEDFIDLHVERKQAIPAADPWSGEWEPVKNEDLSEILQESLGLDLEVVNPLVTRPVITMPLPRRVQGQWSPEEVSHKGIDEFVLSDEEKEIIRKRDEKLAKEAEELKAVAPPMREMPRGFSVFRGNANQIINQLGNGGMQQPGGAGSGNSAMDFNSRFLNEYNVAATGAGNNPGTPGGQMPLNPRIGRNQQGRMSAEELEKLRKKLFDPDATNRLLLVRFVDFTAERGHEYIYRVRLEMNNPNFGAPVDELEQPELSTQKTILSAWSEPTAPVLLPGESRYYVNKVVGGGHADERADLSVYFEDTEKGTPVMADFQNPVGIRIGGKREVEEVADLSKSTLGPSEVDVRSKDLLCAVTQGIQLNLSEHKDLKQWLSSAPRGQKSVPDRILVVTGSGELIERFSGDNAEMERQDRGDTEFVRKEYRELGWGPEGQDANQVAGAYSDDEDGSGGPGGPMMGMGMGRGDPLARGGRRGRRSGGNAGN